MAEEQKVGEALRALVAERDLALFHTPANLAKSIANEVGELLEVTPGKYPVETSRGTSAKYDQL